MSIGKNVKLYRKQRGLTQVQLAQKANLSRSYLADVEADRYNPSVDTLKAIADALQVGSHVLLGEDQSTTIKKEANESIPEWATAKDIRDFKKMLEDDSPVMFDGVPIEGEARQRVMDILTGLFWEAKEMNKKTYGRKKKKADIETDNKE